MAKHYHGPKEIAISFGSGAQASPTSIRLGGCRSPQSQKRHISQVFLNFSNALIRGKKLTSREVNLFPHLRLTAFHSISHVIG